ncbi:hypothetical protein cypCar_00000911, partial [Cyprinus carpio]
SNMSDQDCFGILDSEFDHYLVDMKPYVLKLIDKTDRQRCALWIKKLCDPETCGSGLTGRKNRNMYARLLLHMLRKGVLEGPFTHKPEAGGLKTLPTYMSIYFDEPLLAKSQEQGSAVLPDWVSGELGQTAGSWSTSPLSNTHSFMHKRCPQNSTESSADLLRTGTPAIHKALHIPTVNDSPVLSDKILLSFSYMFSILKASGSVVSKV